MTTLELRSASKTFNEVRVLNNVDLDLNPGEIHALLGHNGSGKSTLIKILAGVYRPDFGASMRIHGESTQFSSPQAIYDAGVRFVHQRLALIPELSVVDNLSLGRPYIKRTGLPLINWSKQRHVAQEILEKYAPGSGLRATDTFADAPAVVRTQFAIGRELADLDKSGVLVLDEPTASLLPQEAETLFKTLDQVRAQGTAILYVTHRLREVYDMADRITLLRDGDRVTTTSPADMPVRELINLFSVPDDDGHAGASQQVEPSPLHDQEGAPVVVEGESMLQVRELRAEGLSDVSFDVKAGEILGVYGLSGSGREDLARALVGAKPSRVGFLKTPRGETNTVSVRGTQQLGVILATESRAAGALANSMTIAENITLPSLSDVSGRFGKIKRMKENCLADGWVQALDIRPRNIFMDVAMMSGGNRQKVVIAKSLQLRPLVLVLDEPTAGVDVNAAASLRESFRELAMDSRSVLLISSDIEEICAIADRVLILKDGEIVQQIDDPDEITEFNLLEAVSTL